ncbi:MAG: glycosyltransferase family 2 protein [Candidatus Dormibacteria bacterium]
MRAARPRSPHPPSVSAVLPAYNEEAVIAHTLVRTHAALAALALPTFEVIVVDDGSTDSTARRCLEVAAELGGIRVVSHRENRGYGAALRTGFEQAAGDAIFLMDSDGQFDPADLRLLLPHWSSTAVVCGCRAERRDPFIRRLSNRAFFRLVTLAFGPTARDVNCGFKLFSRAVGQGLTADGALVSTELLVRARAQGLGIVDVPVPHYPRLTGRPTGARPAVVLRAFAELWRLRRQLRGPQPSPRPAPEGRDTASPAAAHPRGTS